MRTNCLVFAATCLCLLGSASGQRGVIIIGDDAPGDAPEDFETVAPPTSFPETVVPRTITPNTGGNVVCIVDADCQLMDTKATCASDGGCTCSAGFDSFSVGGIVIRDCFPASFNHTSKRPATQTGRFANGDFAAFTDIVRAVFIREWEKATGLKLDTVVFRAGSVVYTATYEANTLELAAMGASMQAFTDGLDADPVASKILSPRSLTGISTGFAANTTCTLEHASQTILVGSLCNAVECDAGYVLFVAGTGNQICIAGRVDDSDDDLSDSAIAGIVIGSVFGCLLLLAVLVFIGLAAKKANSPREESEQAPHAVGTFEEAAPPTAPTEAAAGTLAPPMDQSGAALSVYNTPYGGEMEADPAQSQLLVSNAHLDA
ncbi:hypothetical protein DIPPA_05117 [Diplonema papillatum]|nr:hypothetical protein DIPPA_05117 [Diplonema papillatum]